MLSPVTYRKDLEDSALGRMINHRPHDPQSTEAGHLRAVTEAKWRELFPGEPFTVDTPQEKVTIFASSFSYDILKASSRQAVFYYQVKSRSYCSIYYLPYIPLLLKY